MKLSINFLVLKSNFKIKSCMKKRNSSISKPLERVWFMIAKTKKTTDLLEILQLD
ncbi:hypothetical Protein psc1_05760 [Candidatus Phytoplasma solani]